MNGWDVGKNDESESSRGKWRNFQFFRAILLPCTRTLTNTSSCQIPTKATTHAVSSSSSSPALRLNLKRQFSIANPLFLLISDSSLTCILSFSLLFSSTIRYCVVFNFYFLYLIYRVFPFLLIRLMLDDCLELNSLKFRMRFISYASLSISVF